MISLKRNIYSPWSTPIAIGAGEGAVKRESSNARFSTAGRDINQTKNPEACFGVFCFKKSLHFLLRHELFYMEHPKYGVYVLYSLKDQLFYIGYTTDFVRRMKEHAEGNSASTAPRRPFIPLLCEYYFSKADAMRREQYFKTTPGKRVLRFMLENSLKEVKFHLSPEKMIYTSMLVKKYSNCVRRFLKLMRK